MQKHIADAKRFATNLKNAAIENPVLALGVAAAAVTATAKLINAANETSNSRTYKKEVNRRIEIANQKAAK